MAREERILEDEKNNNNLIILSLHGRKLTWKKAPENVLKQKKIKESNKPKKGNLKSIRLNMLFERL